MKSCPPCSKKIAVFVGTNRIRVIGNGFVYFCVDVKIMLEGKTYLSRFLYRCDEDNKENNSGM